MDVLAPILGAVVSLVVGYLLGGFVERLRRWGSLVDDRIRAVGDAITYAERIRSNLGVGHTERAPGVAPGPQHRTPARIGELHSGYAGVIQAGVTAAAALDASDLATLIGDARDLVASLAPKRDHKITVELVAKLREARREYEALRTKLA